MAHLADQVRHRGGNVNRILSEAHADEGDVHQLNCTYYSVLGDDDERYVAARAIQLFARGVPQIYYVGLLAGANDHESVERTGEGRAINRHDYTWSEIEVALDRSVVKRLVELIRLRNTHPAFDGDLRVDAESANSISLEWRHGEAVIALFVDLADGCATLTDGGRVEPLAEWAPAHGRDAR
jgi:sucrose phosphorylase